MNVLCIVDIISVLSLNLFAQRQSVHVELIFFVINQGSNRDLSPVK